MNPDSIVVKTESDSSSSSTARMSSQFNFLTPIPQRREIPVDQGFFSPQFQLNDQPLPVDDFADAILPPITIDPQIPSMENPLLSDFFARHNYPPSERQSINSFVNNYRLTQDGIEEFITFVQRFGFDATDIDSLRIAILDRISIRLNAVLSLVREEQNYKCELCLHENDNSNDQNIQWTGCDRCGKWFHTKCLLTPPPEDGVWWCPLCEIFRQKYNQTHPNGYPDLDNSANIGNSNHESMITGEISAPPPETRKRRRRRRNIYPSTQQEQQESMQQENKEDESKPSNSEDNRREEEEDEPKRKIRRIISHHPETTSSSSSSSSSRDDAENQESQEESNHHSQEKNADNDLSLTISELQKFPDPTDYSISIEETNALEISSSEEQPAHVHPHRRKRIKDKKNA